MCNKQVSRWCGKWGLLFCSWLVLGVQGGAANDFRDDLVGEIRWQRTVNSSVSEYLIAYAEDGRWVLDRVREERGGFPALVSRRFFPDFPALKRRAAAVVRSASFVPASSLMADPSGSRSAPELLSTAPGSVLWRATERWSWEWERRYAEWVSAHVDEHFFERHGISTDCADVAVAARFIFARVHGLPAGFRLSGSGALFTHESVQRAWLRLPTAREWHEDRRFLAALEYLLVMTYTHSLMRDSYPVAISEEALLPGVHYLSLSGTSGHTLLVYRTDFSDDSIAPIEVVASTMPRQVRELMRHGFWDSLPPKLNRGGFLRVRWLERHGSRWTLKSPASHSSYSLEQYDPDLMKEEQGFAEAVLLKINPGLDFRARVRGGVRDLKEQLRLRADVVREGWQVCRTRDCSKGTAAYEAWSTPSRDRRIREWIEQVKRTVDQVSGQIPDIHSIWDEAMREPAIELGSDVYSLGEAIHVWLHGLYSSEPWDAPDQRWALSPESYTGAVARALTQRWGDREKSIQGSSGETYEVDDHLRRLLSAVTAYCEAAPVERCSRMHSLLDVPEDDMKESASALLARVPWLGSDASLPLERRYGRHRDEYRSKLMLDMPVISSTGLSLSKNGRLRDVMTGVRITPPEGFRWVGLEPGSGRTVAFRFAEGEGRYRFFSGNPARSLIGEIAVPQQEPRAGSVSATWDTDRYLIASNGECSNVIVLADRNLSSERICSSEASSIPGVWLEPRNRETAAPEAGHELIDLRGSAPARLQIDWPALPGGRVAFAALSASVGEYLLVQVFLCRERDCDGTVTASRMVAIHGKTGEVRMPWPSGVSIYPIGGPYFAIYGDLNRKPEIVEIFGDLSIHPRMALGPQEFPWVEKAGKDLYLSAPSPSSGGLSRYVRIRSGRFETAALLADEISIHAATGGRMILGLRSGGWRVRSFDAPSAEFELSEGEIGFWPYAAGTDRSRWIEVKGAVPGARKQVYDLTRPEWPVFDGVDFDEPESDRSDFVRIVIPAWMNAASGAPRVAMGSAVRFGTRGPWVWMP